MFKQIVLFSASMTIFILAFLYFIFYQNELIAFYVSNVLLYGSAAGSSYLFSKLKKPISIESTTENASKAFFFSVGVLFAGIHFFLGLSLIFSPNSSSTSRDAVAYLEMLKNLKQGLVPFVDFTFSYPPAMVLVFYVLVFFNIGSITGLQAFFTFVSALNVFILWMILWNSKTHFRVSLTMFYALIPFNFVEFAINAHNDVIVITFVLLAIFFMRRGNFCLGSLTLFVSVGLKIYPIVLLPVFLFYVMKKSPIPILDSTKEGGKILTTLKAMIFPRGVVGRFLFVWIYCGLLPVVAIMIFRPSILTNNLLVHLTRENMGSIPYMMLTLAFGCLKYAFLSWVLIPVMGVACVWYYKKNGLWNGNSKKRLIASFTVISLFISAFTPVFFLVPLVLFVPTLISWLRKDDDLRHRDLLLLLVDLIGIIIVLTGFNHIFFPFVWSPGTNVGELAFRTFVYRVPLIMYVQGCACIVSGILFLYSSRKMIDSVLRLRGFDRMIFFSVLISILFFMSFRLFYPWYIAWFLPFLMYITSKHDSRFKLISLSFILCFSVNYGAYNFEAYAFPRDVAFTDQFQASDPWTINTNASSGYAISYDNGLKIDLNFPNLPDNPDVIFNVTKSISPIEHNPLLRLQLVLGNPGLRDFDTSIFLMGTLANGSAVRDACVFHAGSRFLWTRNDVTYVLLPLEEIRDSNNNVINIKTIYGVSILIDNFLHRTNLDYVIALKSIEFSYSNPLLF